MILLGCHEARKSLIWLNLRVAFTRANAELITPSPASVKSPPTPQCVVTAFAEATERRILHGHQGWSLRLPSLTHRYGVVFLRCPPQDVPRSLARASMGRPLPPPPLSVATIAETFFIRVFTFSLLACNRLTTGIELESSHCRACFFVPL